MLCFSAGIGRTGTFIALDYLLDETEVQDYVDIQACLHKLRYARVNMVQNLVGTECHFLYKSTKDVYSVLSKSTHFQYTQSISIPILEWRMLQSVKAMA